MKLGGKIVRWTYNNRETTCQISENKDNVLVTASTKRFHKDKPNKRLARDTAFKRAMTQAVDDNSIDKATRGAIWEDYRSNINLPV